MKKLSELTDQELVRAIQIRWADSDSLWSELVKASKHNRKYWMNEWEDPNPAARKTSRARDNRIFVAIEHDTNILTGRPSKPVVLAYHQDDDNAREVAENLQMLFLDLYKSRQVKKKLKRSIRNLNFERMMILYPFWNTQINDVDVRVVDPKKVRIPRYANNEQETEWICEEIEETVSKMLSKFPDKEDDIKTLGGFTDIRIAQENPMVKYKMFWTNELVVYEFRNRIIKRQNNPTWDWNGLVLSDMEMVQLQQLHGVLRRDILQKIKQDQENRMLEITDENGEIKRIPQESTFFYNHFNTPRKPYIFGTIFEVDDGPFGKTDLIHQAAALQDNINRRKRQIEDSADDSSGVFLFDSRTFTKEDVNKFSAKSGSRLYGSNIVQGFKRDSAPPLPPHVFEDLLHSIREIDNLFATQGIIRGEKEGVETAAGRAMLRESSLQRRDESIDLIDYVMWELYNWWLQLIKVNYTELHYVKPLGFDKATRTIEVMQDDIEDGIEIKIIPGQIVPDDKIYRQERAKEEFEAGLLTPLDYYREVGRDKPDELFKRLVMFQINPMSLITLTEQEMQTLQTGQARSKFDTSSGQSIQEIEKYLQSDEFKSLSAEQQQQVIGRVRQRTNQLKLST